MTDIYRKYDDKSQEWGDFGDLKARQDIGIVEDTDIAEHSIASGQYVIWKGVLYIANNVITIGDELSDNNLTIVNNGGLNNLKNDLNTNITNINSNLSAINSSLAIVSDSNTHPAIASGQYVYIKNHSSLAEGLYTANSAIGQNVTLTTSNVTKVTNGGLNNLKSKIPGVDSYPVKNSSNMVKSSGLAEIIGVAGNITYGTVKTGQPGQMHNSGHLQIGGSAGTCIVIRYDGHVDKYINGTLTWSGSITG